MKSVKHQMAEEEPNNYPLPGNLLPIKEENQSYSQTHKLDSLDEEKNVEAQIDQTMRSGFIIKVYGIVAFQLTVSIAFIGCAYIPSYSQFLITTAGEVLLYVSIIGSLTLAVLLSCVSKVARKVPINYILLVLFTVFESYLLQFICLSYSPQSVLIAGILTIGMVVSLALYSLKTKSDYTWRGAALFSSLTILILSSILIIFFWNFYWMQVLFSIFGVLLFSFYLIYDIQLISGKFGVGYTIDDYIMAAMNVYLDIINLFIKLLQIFGSRQ